MKPMRADMNNNDEDFHKPADGPSESPAAAATSPAQKPLSLKSIPFASFAHYCEIIARSFAGSRKKPSDEPDFERRIIEATEAARQSPGDLEPIKAALKIPFFPSMNWLDRAWLAAAELLPRDTRPFHCLAEAGYPLSAESIEFPYQNFWNAADEGRIGRDTAERLAECKVFGWRDFGVQSMMLWALSQRSDLSEFCQKNSNAARLLRHTAGVIDQCYSSPITHHVFIDWLSCAIARMRPDNAEALLRTIEAERAKIQNKRHGGYGGLAAAAFPLYSDWLPDLAGNILGMLYLPEYPPERAALRALAAICSLNISAGRSVSAADAMQAAKRHFARGMELYQNGTPGGLQACARLENALAALYPAHSPDELAQAAAEAGARNMIPYRERQLIACPAADEPAPASQANAQGAPKHRL